MKMEPNKETLFRLPQVESIVGLKRSSIYSRIAQGKFPRPINLGARAVAFRASDIQKWIAERVQMSGGAQ